MENTVRFRITKVSTNTLTMAASPCSWGFLAFALAWAWGVEPMPASLENSPLATPNRMASRTVIPRAAPPRAWGLKAPTTIIHRALGTAVICRQMRIRLPTM